MRTSGSSSESEPEPSSSTPFVKGTGLQTLASLSDPRNIARQNSSGASRFSWPSIARFSESAIAGSNETGA